MFKTTIKRITQAIVLASMAVLFGGWYLQSCDDNTADVPTVSPDSGDLASGASTTNKCKRGLPNIRHRYIAGLPDGSATELYYGGQRTKWCWNPLTVTITTRHTEFPKAWASFVGSGSVQSYVWSSSCSPGKADCLVRAEFFARLEATIPGVSITIGVNERYCVGTRIAAYPFGTGAYHRRNISDGSCPGDGAGALALAAGSQVQCHFEGQLGEWIPQRAQNRFCRLAFSPRNWRYMQRTGEPLPELLTLGRRILERYLTPRQIEQLRKEQS